jgi:hypothetical protein
LIFEQVLAGQEKSGSRKLLPYKERAFNKFAKDK